MILYNTGEKGNLNNTIDSRHHILKSSLYSESNIHVVIVAYHLYKHRCAISIIIALKFARV